MYKTKILKLIFIFLFTSLFWTSFQRPVYAWKFIVAGDTRSNHTAHAKVLAASKSKVNNNERIVYFNMGDVTADGTTADWSTWLKIITGTYNTAIDSNLGINWSIKSPPAYVSPVGNHDTHANEPNWEERWKANLNSQVGLSAYSDIPGQDHGLWGSFKYDNTLFIWLTGYYYTGVSSVAQTDFMQRTLTRSNQDSQVLWKIVIFHQPAAPCGTNHEDWSTGISWSDNYFIPYQVDLILNGHNHYYTRSCPFTSVLSKTCEPSFTGGLANPKNIITGDPVGPIHITSGGGGASLYTPGDCVWLEAKTGQFHFVEVKINGGALSFKTWAVDASSNTYPYLTSVNPIDQLSWQKSTTGPTPTPINCPGDTNYNRIINVDDLLTVLSNWGQTSGAGDVNNDQIVNISDVIFVLQKWGACV